MIRGCAAAAGVLVLLVVLAFAGWLERDRLVSFFSDQPEPAPAVEAAATVPGPELSRRAEQKIIALGRGEVREASLTPAELDGWIRHGLNGFFPGFVSDVTASIDADDRLVLGGRVAVSQIPDVELGPAARFLGDTAAVRVKGRLDTLRPGLGILYVEAVRIGPLPLPEAVRDELLRTLREPGDDLPTNSVTFELPEFVTDIAVRSGQLVLSGRERR